MKIQNSRCLVLNADFSPLTIVNWQRALIWSIKHEENPRLGVEIIDFYKNDYIQGANGKKFPIPAVARTIKYFKMNHQRVNFSRKNIFTRDDNTCQYCGIRKDLNELTYDHVIPKSAWKELNKSPTSWTNIVTACMDCNRKKGSRTPKQANMPLRTMPKEPIKSLKYLPITTHLLKIRTDIPEEWDIYIPNSYL